AADQDPSDRTGVAMSKVATTLEQLRDLPEEELKQALARTRDELFRLHLGQYTNQVTSSAALTTKRRDIARILTIVRARALGTEKQAQGKKTEAAAEAPKKTKKKAKSGARPRIPKISVACAGPSSAPSRRTRWRRPR